jgi:hypothetical protein
MKRAGIVSTAILFLLSGATGLAYAQHEQESKGQEKPQQGQQHQQRQSAPPQHQPSQAQHQKPAQPQHQPDTKAAPMRRATPPQTYGGVYHGGVQPNGPTNGGVHHSGVPQHQGQVRSGFTQSRARSWNTDHRTWGQRGGYSGYRIPQDRFSLYFGSSHSFRVSGLPLVFVGGYPRFQYDGYWVTFVDPWPESWSDNWYDSDDIYLDYTDDGYYLYNRMHPGPGIAVTIAF